MNPLLSSFDIRAWVDADRSGRAACPSCVSDGKTQQKNLSIDLSTGAYYCWRGCSIGRIRNALGAPKGRPNAIGFQKSVNPPRSSRSKKRLYSLNQVEQVQNRLLNQTGQTQANAMQWLESKGFTREMVAYYQLGLEQWWHTPDKNKPNVRQGYGAIALHIPADNQGHYYRKLRVAPWLSHGDRHDDLPKWSQYGVPATIFYTYRPENAESTWFCEGEWDAMRLGWLAKQHNANVAICCSTAGCGTVPPKDQLDTLPGEVVIFFDRNDAPTQNGTIPGDEGARKLALALNGRGRIAQVPMPGDCKVEGWDVSNALDEGFSWGDFCDAANRALAKPSRWEIALSPSELAEHQVSPLPICDRIRTILDTHEKQSERDLAFMKLSRDTPYSGREIEKLAQSLTTEADQETDHEDASQKLKALIQTRRSHLDLRDYLEPWFAITLMDAAQAMPTAPEFLFTTLLPTVASRIGTAAKVVIKASAQYTQPMVFWSAIVAHSGSMKTPSQRIILDPLMKLEQEAHERFQLEMEDYQAAVETQKRKDRGADDPPPKIPIRRRYLTKDSTLESLQKLHAENPRGLLYYRDELAGSIKVRNQYRGGRGADEEAELDQWTGSAVIVDRSDKSICIPRSSISRTGAIQWDVLAKLMGDHQDVNGAWSRWLFCAATTPPRYLNLMNETDSGLADALQFLYTEVEKLQPQDYLLSQEAKQLFETWQHHLVDAQRTENALGLQLVYPKIESYTARLALWLHIVNSVMRGEPPAPVISRDTMDKAIELGAYYLWQHRLIHTHNSPDAGLASLGMKIQKFAERVGEVTASRLKSGIRALRTMAVGQIRRLMQMLAEQGFGFIQGDGSTMTYQPDPKELQLQIDLEAAVAQLGESPPTRIDTVDAEMTQVSAAKTQSEKAPQPPADTFDTIDTFEKSSAPSLEVAENRCSPPCDRIQLHALVKQENIEHSIELSKWIEPSQPSSHHNHQAMVSQSDSLNESANNHHLLQRGVQVLVWVKNQWIMSTYLKPLDALILSHRTGKLDAGHQVCLSDGSHHLCNTHQPGIHRIAASDLWPSSRLDTDISSSYSV
ncbi:MAG: DUF3987 domain-containing protein [Leptolyngbyaceae bacterium]|nr:DUF3987 domain-containing protein [Leptolyngbyaceae bacterium]